VAASRAAFFGGCRPAPTKGASHERQRFADPVASFVIPPYAPPAVVEAKAAFNAVGANKDLRLTSHSFG